MAKKIIIVIIVLLTYSIGYSDEYYEARMARRAKQIDEEIARDHELKKLELEERILAHELSLERQNISVSANTTQGQSASSYSYSESKINALAGTSSLDNSKK